MRMRRILPFLHGAGSALMTRQCGAAQPASGVEREQRDRTPAILRGEQELASRVNCDVGPTAVARRRGVDRLERSVLTYPIRRCARAALKVGDGVQLVAVRMQGEKSRCADFRREYRGRQFAGAGIEA